MHTYKLKLIGNFFVSDPVVDFSCISTLYLGVLNSYSYYIVVIIQRKVLSCFFTWDKKFNIVLHFFIDLKSIHGIGAEIPFILRLNPRPEGSWLSLITYIKKEYDRGEEEVSLRSLEIENTKAIIGSSYQMVCWRNENLSQYTFVFV